MNHQLSELWKKFGLRYKAHPWHGISAGAKAPEVVTAYIEIVPCDQIKYEICKETGYLTIDRPQKFSNIMPCLYGFIPQTYCGEKIAEYSASKCGKTDLVGDGDALDIIVLTEREVPHGDLLVTAVPIGGFRMIDGGEADDKIVAVLKGDPVYGDIKDVKDLPEAVRNRVLHYFLTYKEKPWSTEKEIEITHVYGREEAYEVIKHSQTDYNNSYGNIESDMIVELKKALS
jgi:inorganic pyrophosphatase